MLCQLLSPLEATLTGNLASVDFKGLTMTLTPLDATLTKTRGRDSLLAFKTEN
jgi:hypothetical protein